MNKIDQKIKVKRAPKRGQYDTETIHRILDRDFLCHVGFIHEDYPVVIPTLYGRLNNQLYLHGSNASRMIKDLKKGIPVSLTVTKVDGLVLARSAFHHSMNYESVVVFGNAEFVDDPSEKLIALKVLSDQIIQNRWEEVREPNEKEMKATTVLKISLDKASAKIRKGGPVDDKDDYALSVWAGEIPISQKYGLPIPDELMDSEIKVPSSVNKIMKGLEK